MYLKLGPPYGASNNIDTAAATATTDAIEMIAPDKSDVRTETAQ